MAGEQTTTAQGALPLSYAELVPRQDSNLRLPHPRRSSPCLHHRPKSLLRGRRRPRHTCTHTVREHAVTVGGFAPPPFRLAKYPCPSPLTLWSCGWRN